MTRSGSSFSGKLISAEPRIEILIAEDSPTQAEQLRNILERRDYAVTIARDGRQALALLNEHQPALVISDIVMPEMNGYQLCQQIKTDEHTCDIPVILLTTLSDEEDVLEGLACQADSFITKPYSAHYLLKHIERLLATWRLGKGEQARVEVEIPFAGKRRVISTHPQQMLSLLLSTYQAAVQRNIELAQTQDELTLLNEDLEAKVEQRTAALSNEIIERERLQAELRSLSLSDELTGLHNRRGFILLAEHHWRQALREGDEFALLYADLNDLKQINDAFGHSQGDQALCAIASIMKQTFRGCDTLARIGGDEFTALFANCDLETAQAAVIRLKKNLEQMNGNGPHLQNLSLSVGLAHFSPNNQVSINDLLEQADAAMYAHKKQLKERRAS